ncbi:MAG: transcription-repair coupling factor, partial [Clostridia bacterium]|nr:transcription-repair coupling factor [Clostridia bacterium]
MNCYTEIAKLIPEFMALANDIRKNRLPMGVTGLSHIHKAHVIASLCMGLVRRAAVVMPDEAQATRMKQDLETFGIRALLYPARDFSFRTTETVSREYEHARLSVLDKLMSEDYDAVVFSAEAAMQLTVPPEMLFTNSFELKFGEDYDLDGIAEKLVASGYIRSEQVDGPGQFALRGGILDFFSPDAKQPCRVEFWGDSVDGIAYFDIETQRRGDSLDGIKITPAREILVSDGELCDIIESHIKTNRIKGDALTKLNEDIEKLRNGVRLSSFDKFLPLIYPDAASIFDYCKDAMLFVCESFSVKDKFTASSQLLNETIKGLFQEGTLCKGLDRFALQAHELISLYEDDGAVYLDNLPRGSFDTPVKDLITFTAKQVPAWNGTLAAIIDDLNAIRTRLGHSCAVVAGTEKAAQTLVDDLESEGIPALWCPVPPAEFPKKTVCVLPGSFSAGFEYPSAKFTLITYRGKTPAKV